jgi:hypothetical protein
VLKAMLVPEGLAGKRHIPSSSCGWLLPRSQDPAIPHLSSRRPVTESAPKGCCVAYEDSFQARFAQHSFDFICREPMFQ